MEGLGSLGETKCNLRKTLTTIAIISYLALTGCSAEGVRARSPFEVNIDPDKNTATLVHNRGGDCTRLELREMGINGKLLDSTAHKRVCPNASVTEVLKPETKVLEVCTTQQQNLSGTLIRRVCVEYPVTHGTE
jgi:hypothetical protein